MKSAEVLTSPAAKIDQRKLIRLASHRVDEEIPGLLVTADVPNAFQREDLACLGCVFLNAAGLSTMNCVRITRGALNTILNLPYVLDFDPFSAD
jgi:hypothetical protein